MSCLHTRHAARLKLFFRSANGNSASTSDEKKLECLEFGMKFQIRIRNSKNLERKLVPKSSKFWNRSKITKNLQACEKHLFTRPERVSSASFQFVGPVNSQESTKKLPEFRFQLSCETCDEFGLCHMRTETTQRAQGLEAGSNDYESKAC